MGILGILGDSNTTFASDAGAALGNLALAKSEDSPALHSALQGLAGMTTPSAASGELKTTRTANVPIADTGEGQTFWSKNKTLIKIGLVLVVGLVALRYARR